MNVAELASTLGWDVDFETIARYQSELNQARANTEALEDETRKLAKATAALSELGMATGIMDAQKAMGVVSLGSLPSEGGKGRRDKAKETVGWGRALEYVHAGLGTVTKGYAILSGIAGRVSGQFTATANAAARANDAASRLGISVEAVQELGFAASQSGSDADTLSTGMAKLADKADAASKGGKDAARSLRQVGLSGKDIQSGQVTLDGALGQIADRFAAMPDGARKSALAVDLFGGAGTKLIPLLNKGASGIGELRAEARRLGIVMDGDTTSAVAGLADEQAKLKDQLAGLRNQAIAALVPMLTSLVTRMQEWIAANREVISSAITVSVKALSIALQAVGLAVSAVVEVLAWLSRHSQIATGLIALLGATLLSAGIKAAAAWLFFLGPIAWIIAGVAALIAIIAVAFPHLSKAAKAVASAVSSVFRRAWRWITTAASDAYDAIAGVFSRIGSFFSSVASGIKAVFISVVNWVIDKINVIVDALNWTIRQMNRIPGVDIGKVDYVDQIGASTPMIPDPKTASASVSQTNTLAISVTGANDPAKTSVMVRDEVARYLDDRLTEAAEVIG